MKLLTAFESLPTIAANSEDGNFPAANVKDLDPMKRWRAGQYAADEWILVDFGSEKELTAVFLNQANFPQCRIQGNALDNWVSPSFDVSVDLVFDQVKNRKGWFDLMSFNYRFLRILIPAGQTLDNSEAAPALGNLIAGQPTDLPMVSSFSKMVLRKYFRFEPDAGGLSKIPKGRQRHILTLKVDDSLANVRQLFSDWTMGVVFADLGCACDAWLVFPPDEWESGIESVEASTVSFLLEEKP